MKRLLRSIALAIGVCVCLALATIEGAYRLTVASIRPVPFESAGVALGAHMTCAISAVATGGAPRHIPALYPWTAHRYFDREERGLALAWSVAREWLYAAREREQVRGMGQWHLKGFAATAWVSRNMSDDEVVSRYAGSLWTGAEERGLESGARYWFRKPAAALSDPELALLLGIAQNFRTYDPLRHPDRALERRNSALGRFVDAGCMAASDLPLAQSQPLGIKTATS